MITLTDTAATKVKDLIEAEGETTWRCASPSAPAAARASATRCSSTPTSPPTTSLADYGGVRSWSTRRAPSCSRAPRSTTRTASRGRVRHRQPQRPAHLRLRPVLQLSRLLHAAPRARPAPRRRRRSLPRGSLVDQHDGPGHRARASRSTHVSSAATASPRPRATRRLVIPPAASRGPGAWPTGSGADRVLRDGAASWCCGSKRRTTASTSSTAIVAGQVAPRSLGDPQVLHRRGRAAPAGAPAGRRGASVARRAPKTSSVDAAICWSRRVDSLVSSSYRRR